MTLPSAPSDPAARLPAPLAALGLPADMMVPLQADSGVLIVAGSGAGPWAGLKDALMAARRQLRRAEPPPAAPPPLAWEGERDTGDALQQALRAAAQGGFAILTLQAGSLAEALARLIEGAPAEAAERRAALARHWGGAVWVEAVRGRHGRWCMAAELAVADGETHEAVTDGDWAFIELAAARPRHAGSPPMRDAQLLAWVREGLVAPAMAEAHARDPAAFWQLVRDLGPRWMSGAVLDDIGPAAGAVTDPFAGLFGAGVGGGAGGGPAAPAAAPPRSIPDDWDPFAELPPPAAAPQREQRLQLRAYAPTACAPGRLHAIDLWACAAADVPEVDRLASSAEPRPLAGLSAGLTLARGAVLCVRLSVGTLRVEPAVQRLAWTGDPVNATFMVDVPPDAPDGDLLAQAQVHADEVAVGTVVFAFRVRTRAPAGASPAVLQAEMRTHRSAFASYASEDREAMLARIAGIQSWVRDFEVFIDVQALRAGERWQARIDAELARRDRLLLFWSSHARDSPWVDYEWRAAARLKGVDAIDPVPLEDPRDAPPPAELAHLHFGDPLLPLIAAERRRHTAR